MRPFIGALAVSATGSAAAFAGQAEGPAESAVRTVVESVATLADRGRFTELERLFSEEVFVDYSSLSGIAGELKSNSALMEEWAGLLPGFDRTRHALSDIAVDVHGSGATATADVTASHWIDDEIWSVDGRYDYALALSDDEWRITSMTFTLLAEHGSREVMNLAAEAAALNPPPYILRRQTRGTVLDFLEGLAQKDMQRVDRVWADDAVQELPYSPAGFPRRVVGRGALIAHDADWPTISGKANFTDGIVFYPTLDPRTVFVEFRGSVGVLTKGRHDAQQYGGLFHVLDGKIALFREYCDPIALADAFGLEIRAPSDRSVPGHAAQGSRFKREAPAERPPARTR